MLKEGLNQRRCRSMKVTESGNLKHRQLRFEDYLQRVSAEQREDAEVCEPSKMTETDSTNTEKQTEGLLERILSKDNLNRYADQKRDDCKRVFYWRQTSGGNRSRVCALR
jgi:hypothetical protein